MWSRVEWKWKRIGRKRPLTCGTPKNRELFRIIWVEMVQLGEKSEMAKKGLFIHIYDRNSFARVIHESMTQSRQSHAGDQA